MTVVLQAFMILGIICYFILILFFLRNKSLNLKYSLLWIITGIVMLIIAIFPHSMAAVARLLGISSVVNTVFALELFFQMVILMSITSIVSKQNDKSKRLTQTVAMLEKRVRELEEKF